ncbi:MAG: copper ion binding protein, partial [Tepidanaerobacteraceae bacterium]
MAENIEKASVKIKGMTCAACAARIQKVVGKMPGVQDASVNFATEKLNVTFEPEKVSVEDFIKKVRDAGYDVVMDKAELGLKGMSCAACAARIEKALSKAPGVYNATVNFATETATVEFNSSETSLKNLIKVVRDAGYDAFEKTDVNIDREKEEREREIKNLGSLAVISAILSAPLLFGMFLHMMGMSGGILFNPWFQLAVSAPVQFIIGFRYYKGAYHALKGGGANMDVLVAMGTSAAFFYSLYNA